MVDPIKNQRTIMNIPDSIISSEQLERVLATPYEETIECLRSIDGDIVILGVGGKMGPSLARLAVNATQSGGKNRTVIGVSRFTHGHVADQLREWGVRTINCDLSKPEEVAALPESENVIFMAGRKFGASGTEPETWLMNTIVPAEVARYYRNSRIVVFSTGCVYNLVSHESGGSKETDNPQPVGEYANSCLGRERVFEYYSKLNDTRMLQFRLNYAIDLRYGVLLDIGRAVYEGEEIDITVNEVNIIWQGDANNRALLSLAYTAVPPAVLNVTGNETLFVSDIAMRFGELFDKDVRIIGTPKNKSYISDASRSIQLFGKPKVEVDHMIRWTADWIKRGGEVYGKPTLFHITDGNFLL
jgi:nucleoside-diphosphate-sugar epimerase